MKRRVLATLCGILLLSGALIAPARAQETATPNPEIERLKAQLAAQQEQIDQLRRTSWTSRRKFWIKPASRNRPAWAKWPARRRSFRRARPRRWLVPPWGRR